MTIATTDTNALGTALTRVGQFDPKQPVLFSVNTDEIEKLRQQYLTLTIEGPADLAGFEAVHQARMACVRQRSAVERQRKEFKAAALEYGRSVDAAAKQIVALIDPIERHLTQQEDAWKAECARIKREAEEAKQRALQQRLDQLLAVGCTMNPLLVSAMDAESFDQLLAEKTKAFRIQQEQAAREAAERARQEAEREEQRKAEEARLAAERQALEAERKKLEAEREEQRQEQQRLEAERHRLEREEAERQRQALIEREKEAAAERARQEAEERMRREAEEARLAAERESARQRFLESLRPDREKLLAVAEAVERISVPEVSTAAREAAEAVRQRLALCAADIRDVVASELE